MGPDPAAGRARRLLAPALALLTATGVALGGLHWPAVLDALVLSPDAINRLQLWRLWSGHLVHLTPGHAALNLAALAVLLGAAARLRRTPGMLVAALALMPVLSLALLLGVPDLAWYAGLSGLLHGLAAWLLARLGGWRAAAGIALLGAKLLWEATHGPLSAPAFPVLLEAHQYGALAGIVLAGAGTLLHPSRVRTRQGRRRQGPASPPR